MAIAETPYIDALREQVLASRARLNEVIDRADGEGVRKALQELDAALHRIEHGEFGMCEACDGVVEEARLRENPTARICLDCLTERQQRALEYDLELAAQLQKGLVLSANTVFEGWEVAHYYEPAGMVGGDYCDVIRENGHLYFIMADVSGKGVAAAMLASNLRAVFRSLIPLGLSIEEFMVRANRLFRESALPSQYATTVFGRTSTSGELELVNVGHPPVLLTGKSGISRFESMCRPLGIFEDDVVCISKAQMAAGDTLVLYTDGISEAANEQDEEYGVEAVAKLVAEQPSCCPAVLVQLLKQNLSAFRGRAARTDDETVLAIQYAPAAGQTIAA